jgi:hypothetical protein
MAVVSILGLVRGYAWPVSLASQCQAFREANIPHWDLWSRNTKVLIPDLPFLLVLALLLCGALLLLRRRW